MNTVQKEKNILYVGVGGAGCNVLLNTELNDKNILAINTDIEALKSFGNNTLQIGKKLLKGFGAGMQPANGEMAALESYNEIKKSFENVDFIVVISGLGGGTGSGALPIIADIIQELKLDAHFFISSPFSWEGSKRKDIAQQSLDKLKSKNLNLTLVDFETYQVDRNTGLRNIFLNCNEIVFENLKF